MKGMTYLPLALLLAAPALCLAETEGEVNIGLRATHYASGDHSAKFEEYRDQSDGLFGNVSLNYDSDDYYIWGYLENPGLDDQSYKVTGGMYGTFKATLYYDELTHYLSDDALTPASPIGSDFLVIPDPVPDISAWTQFDYKVERKVFGGDVTVDTESPFYYRVSLEQQQHEGTMPYGLTSESGFELPMPIDYTTNNLMAESGYRSQGTTVVLAGSFSDFNNDNELLTVVDGGTEEYGTPPDNYSYTLSGRLRQQLPMNSLLGLKASYTRNVSEADFSDYVTIPSPTADDEFDGDVSYFRANVDLTTRVDEKIDTRFFYSYVDRENDSDQIAALDEDETNNLYEYDKHQAGIDFNYRFNRENKLNTGYEFTYMDSTREDADTSADNLLFGQLNNTSLEWLSTKFRLEYLNRDSDSDYSVDALSGDGLIRQFFTPFDAASKDRYKAKLSFDVSPMEMLDLGLSYALVYDNYDATELGVQDDLRHEIYLDANLLLKSKVKVNTYAGYEYTKSDFDARRFNPGGADINGATTANNYNWSQETTYDFFTIGGSVTMPVRYNLDLVASADYQVVDGNIDSARSAAAGVPLEAIDNADDYYKTDLGLKAIYKATDTLSFTVGYLFEKANLDEWKYEDYVYNSGSYYLSGAGLDSDYEAHQFFLITTYRF